MEKVKTNNEGNKKKYAVTNENNKLPPDSAPCREKFNKKIKTELEKKKGKLMYKGCQ